MFINKSGNVLLLKMPFTFSNVTMSSEKSEISRHVLPNTMQHLEQLMDLAKDCCCKSVSTKMYRKEVVRDVIIRGIRSNHVRQRLLEKDILDPQRAFELVKQLNAAPKQLIYRGSIIPTPCSEPQGPDDMTGSSGTERILSSLLVTFLWFWSLSSGLYVQGLW